MDDSAIMVENGGGDYFVLLIERGGEAGDPIFITQNGQRDVTRLVVDVSAVPALVAALQELTRG